MANDRNKYMLTNVDIEEALEDLVTDEFTCVVFECKTSDCSEECASYKWFKDGKRIDPSRKHKISCDGKWYRLEITSITAYDQGVYSVILKSNTSEVFSKANLYVRPIRDRNYNNNNNVLYMNVTPKTISVVRHLRCAKVLVGDTIELEAEFNEDCQEDYLWYKSNRPLIPYDRTIILNDKRSTTLSILCAKEADSGIYHVVSKSEHGIASSFASVVVINTDLNTLNTSEAVPSIEEALPDEIEANEGEEVRLMCKATYDVNTVVLWNKNGTSLENNGNVTEYYNNRYVCLRIKNTSINDSGEYTVAMKDDITGHLDSSSCFLNINTFPKSKQSSIKLKSPLVPTVACFGSRISFTCSFAIEDPRFHFAVWYIGTYRVERTNHRFHVIEKGGNFLLIVKQVEPGMAGEVTCEIRKALPSRKSIFIIKTTTSLAIVPLSIIEKEIKDNELLIKRNVYYNVDSKLNIVLNKGDEELNGNGLQKGVISANGIAHNSKGFHNSKETSGLVITYCSLDDESFYLDVSNDEEIKAEKLCIYKKPLQTDLGNKNNSPGLIIIEWEVTKVDNSKREWYKIEIGKPDNGFAEAGISSLPMFEMEEPQQEHIMIFRITAVTCPSTSAESRIRIVPAVRETRLSSKSCELKPMSDFETKFTKTGDSIGCGAFGSVVLVRDMDGEFYAAKILKTRTKKKRETAIREYEMMKRLQHPKLIQLYDAFITKDAVVFVMDYLWGSELFDRIVEEEHIKEVDVVPYVRQICEALLYLHYQRIAHLDLKPENIICLSPNSRQVKIIDFGLARVLKEGQVIRAIYGTRDYVAPEVLNFERLTLACDMWSLGVVTYMLLSGVMPFSGDSWPQRSANITMANYNYHESAFKEISDLAKDFVDHLLVSKPEERMNASTALNHQWILEGPPSGSKAGHMKRTRENLKSYLANYRARWQRAGNVMIAAHRLRTRRAASEADRQPTVT